MSKPIPLKVDHTISHNELVSYKGPPNILINEIKRSMAHSLFQQAYLQAGHGAYILRVKPLVSSDTNEHTTTYTLEATLTLD